MSTSSEPASRTRPGRWKRRSAYLAVGALVVLAAAPLLAGPLLEGVLVRELEARLALDARLGSASFRWPARLRLRGLELLDESGARCASLDELALDLRLGALLAGRLEAEATLVYPELHVARTSGGEWNWERALVASRARDEREDSADEDSEVPEVRLHVVLTDGHVILHGPEGETTLADIALELLVEDLAAPAPFRLSLAVRGPDGPAGTLELAGSFTAAKDARIEPATLAAEARLTLARIDVAALAPALALVAPIAGLGGVLNGTTELTLGSGLALSGASALTLEELTVEGPLSHGTATRLARVELSARATQEGSGAGTQAIELAAESFLSLTYAGRSQLDASGSGNVTGELRASAELGRLAEVARAWVPFQPGVTLGGRATSSATITATLREGAPATLGLALDGGLEALSARAPDGRALELAELRQVEVELAATADLARDTLSLPSFSLQAGPLSCSAALETAGLRSAGPVAALRSGSFRLQADLDRLRSALASLVDLGPQPLAGKLAAEGALSGGSDALELDLKVEGSGLALLGMSLAEVRGSLTAARAGAGGLSGRGELTLGTFVLPLAERSPFVLPPTSATFRLGEEPSGAGTVALTLAATGGRVRLGLEAQTQRDGEGLTAEGKLELTGAVAELATLAQPFVSLQPGLEGELSLRGGFRARARGGQPESIEGKLDLSSRNLAVADAAGVVHRLEALAETTLALEGRFDAGTGRAELSALRLDAGGLTLTGSARLGGLGAGARAELEDCALALDCDPDRIGRELSAVIDLGGWSIAGSPLTGALHCTAPAGRIEAEGRARTASLRLVRPTGRPVELAELDVSFGAGYDLALGSLHVREAKLRSRAATLTLSGTLNELANPARARGAMHLEGTGELGALLLDLGLENPASGRRLDGSWKGEFSVEGDQGSFRVTGRSVVERFQLTVPPAEEGGAALSIEEPSLMLAGEARIGLEALDVELEKLTIDSGLARGGAQGRIENLRGVGGGAARLRGLTGQLAYVPDRMGVVLAPWLPGKLSGAEEQRVTFTLDGELRELDLASLLAGSQGRVDLGLGRFERPEIVLGGNLALESKGGELTLRGDLAANEGTLQIDGALALAGAPPASRSRLSLTTKELRANAGLAPFLALVHPLFANLGEGTLEGLIDLTLDLAYDAPLSPEMLAAGWEALPKTPISGTGRLSLRSASLRGSPLLGLLAGFGVDVGRTIDLRPIEFSIQKGRVSYAKPWTWSFAGTETTFSGSLGLDQSLDLAWNVPVDEALVGRFSFLESLRGETLSLPLRGSLHAPRLESDELLRDLAAKVAKRELEGRLGLGASHGEDPATILARADELWSKGDKTAAAALYARLREDFKLSLTYALNKDRIRDRSKYKETPR